MNPEKNVPNDPEQTQGNSGDEFVTDEFIGIQTKTKSGKLLKLDTDVFYEAKLAEKKQKELEISQAMRNKGGIIRFFLELLVILLIVSGIRAFIATPFQVDGDSMRDTLYNEERIFVNKISTYSGNIKRQEIIVFRPPYASMIAKRGPICALKELFSSESDLRKLCGTEPQHFIKRVIGLPGDTLEIKGGKVYLLDESGAQKMFRALNESYLNKENAGKTCFNSSCTSKRDVDGERFVVPAGEYFVLGDNRLHSSDSRSAFDTGSSFNRGTPEPFVPLENIVGTVRVILWPPSRWEWFSEME
ncbi:signal peptidase I [Candidatus Peregrinibacteria bacterium]|nr:signal peptidase I [Candidatus Peregrinibacteria bacterium]